MELKENENINGLYSNQRRWKHKWSLYSYPRIGILWVFVDNQRKEPVFLSERHLTEYTETFSGKLKMTYSDEIQDSHSYICVAKERLSQANIMSHVILHSFFAEF